MGELCCGVEKVGGKGVLSERSLWLKVIRFYLMETMMD